MLRPWTLNIVLRRNSDAAVHLQIANALIEEIRKGRLAPGSALPGSRALADQLEVNRKTVIQAYDELVAQGWLTAGTTRGTTVSADFPVIDQAPASTRTRAVSVVTKPDFPLSARVPNVPYVAPTKGMLTFDDGAPDTRLAPVEELSRAYRRALMEAVRGNRLGYSDPKGSLHLRQAVATMLNVDRGLSCTVDNICLVRGSQMGIYLAARLLVRPGDVVVMEALSYPPAREAFLAAGAQIATVELDAQGLKVEQLERLCRTRKVRAVYITPHHQFPTTVVLRPDRRLYLTILAEQFGFAVVEDDYDHEFQFDHRPMLPLASADRGQKVIYIGSLSKLLTPSIRVGYMHASTTVIERAAAEIMIIDRQGDPATENAVAELMESGAIKRHTRNVLRHYAERRLLLASLLKDQFDGDVSFTLSPGGLAIWVQFAGAMNMNKLEAAARNRKLGITAGSNFGMTGQNVKAARMGFASLDPVELEKAVKRLAQALTDM